MHFWSSGQFYEILMALITAFVITIMFIKLLYPFAKRVGLIDHLSERKYHAQETPLIGGISMFLGLVFGLLILPIDINILKGYLLVLMLIVILGAVDDYRPQSHLVRLSFQLAVGFVLINVSDIQIHSLGDLIGTGDLILGVGSTFITIVAVAGSINAINFMDGVDGVSGGTSLVTIVAIIILSYNSESLFLLQFALLILITLIPFLFFNLGKTKKIFMGDAGSMLLGLSIAILLIGLSQGGHPSFRPVTALWIFALPLLDIFFVMAKRIVNGDSPFLPDRRHIHYVLLNKGLSEKQTFAVIVLISTIFAMIGVFSELMIIAEWKMFGLFFASFLIYIAIFLNLDRQTVN